MATEYNINKTTCLKEGQLWMNLVEFLDGTDEESSNDADDLNEEDNETMKLKREDMPLFGICPSRDEVYFVVCEHCKQVFKPQALVHHIERRHSNHVSHTSTKLTQSSLLKANGKNDLKINELNGSETKLLNCANSSVNTPLNAIVETNKNSDNVLKSDSTANSSIGLEPTGPGPGPGPDPGPGLINVINSNCDQKTIVKTAKKKSYKKSGLPSTRKLLPCKDREYDANKHCGVWLPDMEKPCTRSLTCKTHSLTLRRAVQGRIKNFDELLAEHRAEKEEALRAQGIEVKPTKKDLLKMQRQQQLLLKQQKLEASQSSKCNNSSATKQTLQIHTESINLKNSSITKENVNSVSTTLSSSTLSQQSQPINVHMNHHPQPVALCNYNVRRISSCVRLTNRKWDLTASLLMSAFNSPKVKSVIGTLNASEKNNTNNNLSSYTTNSIKNPILNNQLSPLKRLHVELNPLELQTQSDPYNFPDAAPITNSSSFNSSSFNSSSFNSSSFTLIKPKTPTAKNSFLPSVNKKRKNDTDIKLNSDQHSSLLNGQLSQSLNKKACVNSKRSNNNSNKKVKTNISSINLPTTNSQDQQIFHSSTSLNTLHNKNLNDLLSNSNDTYPDNGSILLNGSLLSNHILDKNKGIYKNTNTTLNMNKSLCKKGSPSTISSVNSISQAKTINKQIKPLVIPSQSQHSNQNVMIESTQSSQSHQMLSTTLPSSKFLMTKSDEFPT